MSSQDYADLLEFSKDDAFRDQFPKLHAALLEFSSVVGLEDVKEQIFKKIKSLLVFDLGVFSNENKKRKRSERILKNQLAKQKLLESSLRRSKRLRVQKKNKKKTCLGDDNDDGDADRLFIRMIVQQSLFKNWDRLDAHFSDSDDDAQSALDENNKKQEDACEKEEEKKKKNKEPIHAMLLGPPGTGKTLIAHKLYKLFEALGLVASDSFHIATRASLVAGYLGQTALKVEKLAASAHRGVIFIDEAYDLVHNENDSFGHEALNAIIEIMTNPKKEVTFFFAGYEHAVMNKLFRANEGLLRRVKLVLNFKPASARELALVFHNEVNKEQLVCSVSENDLTRCFELHRHIFIGNFADMRLLCDFAKQSLLQSIWKSKTRAKTTSIALKDVAQALQSLENMRKNTTENKTACLAMYS